MNNKKYLLIVNLGTPVSLDKRDVSDYLAEFLMDPGVISLPFLLRFILVKGIIVPKRVEKVIQRYEQVWDDKRGSPLKYHSEDLVKALQNILKDEYEVRLAMLYGSSDIYSVMEEIRPEEVGSLTILPMFPHETPATTGAVKRRIQKIVRTWLFKPSLIWVLPFFAEDWFVKTLAKKISTFVPANYDHIVFSFHGLPLKQVHREHPGKNCRQLSCYKRSLGKGPECYTQVCYQTGSLLAKELGLKENQFTVSFQSRFGRNWTTPYTNNILNDLAKMGKSVLLVSPSFIIDCLETTWEIGISFQEEFLMNGGKDFAWVPSLNADPDWALAISEGIK